VSVIVVDKSVIIAAPRGLLKTLGLSFLLTDTLLFEIATERKQQGPGVSLAHGAPRQTRVPAILKRAMQEAGNSWVERESAMRWELEEGVSAGDENAPRFGLTEKALAAVMSCSSGLYQQCVEYEAAVGSLASIGHAPDEEESFQWVRRLSEQELFARLRQDFCSPEGRARIAKEAGEGIGQRAKKRGYRVSAGFDPRPSWLAFGMILSKKVFIPWKFWCYGDEPADRRKRANPWFDTEYIAYMAIADGLLSADVNQLKLAWACWPEKEPSIYSLDTQDHTISQFRPEWPK